ncbi:probable E3 ubiquitin-protein ligase MARCH10 [Dendrobium catenatum]|uniref:E3 ubiquitin-protein ligase MARCH6 n=1 Tax=Dendrobium catenatum TaxID=906689 RepID=A0A2I0WN77_9ASPA|nr:probable E3 ubiquitin-protein ligase MARCH10 [Dendrobium catenatum]PKU77114.1 E3 ubiquitin-protein ligase MARCH6 [Dendrobium catenatum]
MACLEERHPQFENFVVICLNEAEKENCNSNYETKLPYDYCQLSTTSNVEKVGIQMPCRSLCNSDSSAELDLECGSVDVNLIMDKSEKDCRICSINLDTCSQELGIPIVLGCSCNGDLAFAHQKCAEKWFNIRGNKICEICGSTAKNLIGFGDTETIEDSIKSDNNVAAATETQRFCQGHRLINCILGWMLLTIVLCYLLGFHTR